MKNKPILEFVGIYKDFRFVVIFQPMGYRCGYVLVPHYHDVYEKRYEDINVQCHGGLTYSSHILMGTQYPSWWIGFDCAYAGDIVDRDSLIHYYGEEQNSYNHMMNYVANDNTQFGTVKTLDFCITECKNIIDQLENYVEK